ncbi:hypothetical protein Anapl_13456 [Anas platyrhynchos]|uniref:Uncharacterized protein n=1 Tax=Anas platyrhynchos TaxID=8839 RepID=R0LNY1_ANAPL|nr:hypothetical protein Anapl_13456 [Anas platyrhynchos]
MEFWLVSGIPLETDFSKETQQAIFTGQYKSSCCPVGNSWPTILGLKLGSTKDCSGQRTTGEDSHICKEQKQQQPDTEQQAQKLTAQDSDGKPLQTGRSWPSRDICIRTEDNKLLPSPQTTKLCSTLPTPRDPPGEPPAAMQMFQSFPRWSSRTTSSSSSAPFPLLPKAFRAAAGFSNFSGERHTPGRCSSAR